MADLHDVVAASVPDREMLVCGPVRRTFAEVVARSRGLAAFFVEHDVTLRRERADLARWEKGQDAVALVLHNCCEYVEAMLGAYRARAVPFNVNQHYRPAELGALLAMVGPRAAVYHRRYGPLLAEAVDSSSLVLVDVDDGSGVDALPGSTPFETAVATPVAGALPTPSPDDLYLVCTGGTTGTPKAVLWRQADIYCSAMSGAESATAEAIAATAAASPGQPWFALPPLMHAAAQWTAFSGLLNGATALLRDDSTPYDAAAILHQVARERVFLMTIVGDAYARPLIEELRRRPYDVSSLLVVATGGAATSAHLKEELLELLPHVTVMDGYGASETGGMAFDPRSRGHRNEGFSPGAGATVVSADRTRVLAPGEEEVGWTARRGRVPLGYLGERERTEVTFPIVDGQRMAVPGDRAQFSADGTIRLLGRESGVINTGGEKVFAEEVEAALVTHPDVEDALVVGRPSERFGHEVVAVVSLRAGATVAPGALREHVAAGLARFKAPRAVLVCDAVRRLPNGKADYAWANEVASDAVDATLTGAGPGARRGERGAPR